MFEAGVVGRFSLICFVAFDTIAHHSVCLAVCYLSVQRTHKRSELQGRYRDRDNCPEGEVQNTIEALNFSIPHMGFARIRSKGFFQRTCSIDDHQPQQQKEGIHR